MARFFKNFDIIDYRFGDNEPPVLFNNISQYVDMVDQLKDNVSFYNKYTIVAGERPDTLAYELYGNTDYYWTFYEKSIESSDPVSTVTLRGFERVSTISFVCGNTVSCTKIF